MVYPKRTIQFQQAVPKDIKVGDKLTIMLNNFPFPLHVTAYKVNRNLGKDPKVLFIFDSCVAFRPMNENNTNDGGYWQSDLRWWLETDFYDSLPEWIKTDIFGLSILSCYEVFGAYDSDVNLSFIPALNLMNQSYYRGASNSPNYWLADKPSSDDLDLYFCCVDNGEYLRLRQAKEKLGVRPEFWMPIREESNAKSKCK